jgi:hypothetical protein
VGSGTGELDKAPKLAWATPHTCYRSMGTYGNRYAGIVGLLLLLFFSLCEVTLEPAYRGI